MKTLLVTVLLAALLAAAPVSAQRTSRLHLGVTVTSMHGHVWENTMAGAYGGVSFDMRDYLRLGVLYVQKGRVWGDRLNSTGERVHSIEVPVLYKHTIAKNTHLLVGAAPSYDYYLDIGAGDRPGHTSGRLPLRCRGGVRPWPGARYRLHARQ